MNDTFNITEVSKQVVKIFMDSDLDYPEALSVLSYLMGTIGYESGMPLENLHDGMQVTTTIVYRTCKAKDLPLQ